MLVDLFCPKFKTELLLLFMKSFNNVGIFIPSFRNESAFKVVKFNLFGISNEDSLLSNISSLFILFIFLFSSLGEEDEKSFDFRIEDTLLKDSSSSELLIF